MWTPLRGSATLVACVLATACSHTPPHAPARATQSALASPAADCWRDSLHPSPAPPAEGMWTSTGSAEATRVAAMIGPPEVRTGSTVVTRSIETVEGADSPAPVRARLGDAVVRLELVPPYLGEHRDSVGPSGGGDELEPAGVYAVTPLVSVVSYEGCAGLPAVRYLRRNPRGGIASDAMLRKARAQR